MTAKNGGGPKRGWLEIAKTTEARNKIRGWFKREKRDENIAAGKAEVEAEFKRNHIRFDSEEEYRVLYGRPGAAAAQGFAGRLLRRDRLRRHPSSPA